MPVLPLIDLMILLGSASLVFGAAIKAIWLTTSYRPYVLGFGPMDFLVIAGICFIMALTLAARTWVKLNEPKLAAARREQAREEARRVARQYDFRPEEREEQAPAAAVGPARSEAASADRS